MSAGCLAGLFYEVQGQATGRMFLGELRLCGGLHDPSIGVEQRIAFMAASAIFEIERDRVLDRHGFALLGHAHA